MFPEFTHLVSMLSVVVMNLQSQLPCSILPLKSKWQWSLLFIGCYLMGLEKWLDYRLTPFHTRSLAWKPVTLINCVINENTQFPYVQKFGYMLKASERIINDEKMKMCDFSSSRNFILRQRNMYLVSDVRWAREFTTPDNEAQLWNIQKISKVIKLYCSLIK